MQQHPRQVELIKRIKLAAFFRQIYATLAANQNANRFRFEKIYKTGNIFF